MGLDERLCQPNPARYCTGYPLRWKRAGLLLLERDHRLRPEPCPHVSVMWNLRLAAGTEPASPSGRLPADLTLTSNAPTRK